MSAPRSSSQVLLVDRQAANPVPAWRILLRTIRHAMLELYHDWRGQWRTVVQHVQHQARIRHYYKVQMSQAISSPRDAVRR